MPPTEAELIRILERSFLLVERAPGRLEPLAIPGLRGVRSPLAHPLANRVLADGLTEATADAAIAASQAFFGERGAAFGFIVGPEGGPSDLGDRLVRHGFARVATVEGMASTDLEAFPPDAPGIAIRPVPDAELPRHLDAFTRAYGMPREVGALRLELRAAYPGDVRADSYLAYLEGDPEPAAFADLVRFDASSAVLLGGAATRREHRGRGLYRSLVGARLRDARRAGADAAVIQALRGTSAPICARLGFRTLCVFEVYAWPPPGAERPRA